MRGGRGGGGGGGALHARGRISSGVPCDCASSVRPAQQREVVRH